MKNLGKKLPDHKDCETAKRSPHDFFDISHSAAFAHAT